MLVFTSVKKVYHYHQNSRSLFVKTSKLESLFWYQQNLKIAFGKNIKTGNYPSSLSSKPGIAFGKIIKTGN